MIFIIPGKKETLRVSGEARIVRDEGVRQSMAVNGKVLDLAVVVYVERIFMHCTKCMVRSKIWEPEEWPDHSDTASIQQAMLQHGQLTMSGDELRAEAEASGTTRSY